MGKLDLKFLLMLFLPMLGFFCIFFGEQIYRGQLAESLQDQQIAFNKDEAIEVSAKLFSQDCVGFNRRHGLHRNGLELVYVYAFRGQTYTKTFFAPMSIARDKTYQEEEKKLAIETFFLFSCLSRLRQHPIRNCSYTIPISTKCLKIKKDRTTAYAT